MTVPAWREALSGLDIFAVALCLGVTGALLWLLPFNDDAEADAVYPVIRHRLRCLLLVAVGLLTLSSIAELLSRTIAMSGLPLSAIGTVIVPVLTRTGFGSMWMVRAIAVVMLAALWFLITPRQRQPIVNASAFLLVGVVAYTRSATGHAGDHGDFGLSVWMDWLHLVAAGLWGGVIVAYMVAVRPIVRPYPTRTDGGIIKRFSMLAATGLFIAVATGIYNAWELIGAWLPLWTTRYGLILDIKIGLVAVMAALGASNRFWHVPGVAHAQSQTAWRRLATTAMAEAILWVVILAVAAVLINGMPPVDAM